MISNKTEKPDNWNPSQYNRFQKERSAPFYDLMNMVSHERFEKAIDLGCGTGELTRILHEHFSIKNTIGTDSSRAMLDKARGINRDGVSFRLDTIEKFGAANEFDLIFTNAALQWVDGHPELLGRFYKALKPGGQLAIQVPANYDYATHTIATELASEERFSTRMNVPVRKRWVLSPEEYAELLYRSGFKEQSVRMHVYAHVLPSREDAVEWVKGTLLNYYQGAMTPEVYAEFLAEYKDRLFKVLSDEKPFFYPFKRILMWAKK